MAASRTRGNVTLAVGYRSMNAVVEGVGHLAPEPHTAVRRYEVRSTTFEERLHEMLTMQTPQHYPQTSQQPSLQYVDILKLDCEGCEAEVYHELLSRPSLAGRIRAVTGELHGCHVRHLVRHGTGTRTSTFLKQQCQRMAQYFREHWNRTGGDALMLV